MRWFSKIASGLALLIVSACGADVTEADSTDSNGDASHTDAALDAEFDPDVEQPDLDADGLEDAEPDDGGLADGGPPDPVDSGNPGCVPSTQSYVLRHLQASMQRTDSLAQRNANIDAAFAASAHSISWTEIENLSDAKRIDARAGWATYWPSGKAEQVARNAVPVSWRTDTFKLVVGKHWKASDGLAKVSPSRWVTRVWLTHIPTGLVQSRIAHHSVSGVDGGGKAPVAWRQKAHAQNIAKFKEVIQLDSVPVVGSADFNTVRLRTLLGPSFLYDVPANGGSHGSRLIDWIVRRKNPDLTLKSSKFLTLANADHKGVRAEYAYKPGKDCN